MQVRNRYGGIQNLPDRVARALIKAGTVTAIVPAKPIAPEPKKARKAKEE